MRIALLVFFLVSLSAISVRNKGDKKYFVIWNIGQGQWVTAVNTATCEHFDVGGETFPWKKISQQCADKVNRLHLSHWDWDHLSALAKWPKKWKTCIALRPTGESSVHKMLLLQNFNNCQDSDNLPEWHPATAKDSNGKSHVVEFEKILIPGDSPIEQEATWEHQPWITNTKILILGHHGSRTSTSSELLAHLPHLQMAIASARWRRYKHPHPETLARLKKAHIAVLKTEDWGNIWIER